jgi:hypothetical protein
MFKHTTLTFLLCLGGICTLTSCQWLNFNKPPVHLPDTIPVVEVPPPDSVTLEIFTVRLALHQNDIAQQLWREIDEQSLPPQRRRELLAEGFRVGILGNQVSPTLARLIAVSNSETDAVRESASRNVLTLLPNMHAPIKIFDDQHTLPELPLFWMENGMYSGQIYQHALGLLSVSAKANKDGSAHIQIVPALEHGNLSQHWRIETGALVQSENRPRRTFESLTVSQRLQAGQWLIIGATTSDSAGAGKAFFVRQSPVSEQRFLAIRFVKASITAQ